MLTQADGVRDLLRGPQTLSLTCGEKVMTEFIEGQLPGVKDLDRWSFTLCSKYLEQDLW